MYLQARSVVLYNTPYMVMVSPLSIEYGYIHRRLHMYISLFLDADCDSLCEKWHERCYDMYGY